MGFPAGYHGLHVSTHLFHVLVSLAYIQNAICCLLSFLGVARPVEHEITQWQDFSEIPLSNFSASGRDIIKDKLPVITFQNFAERFSTEIEEDVMCAVCLSFLKQDDEIRELCNCWHTFHRNCLDKWIDYDEDTCPLCRSPLLPQPQSCDADEDGVSFLFAEDLIDPS